MEITLPGGTVVGGQAPIVIIGANGSGKTRLARSIEPAQQIEFVNALRNTRVAPQVPAIRLTDARNNLTSQRQQAVTSHWELQSDFENLLGKVQAEDAAAAIEFRDATRNGRDLPETWTKMERIRTLWKKVFPGREILIRDNAVIVRSTIRETIEYSANTMSDAERAALYLAAKILDAESEAILVDEPENHFHSLLAVQLWDVLEAERSDVRFIYITHDLPFALSRRGATFVLASPPSELRVLNIDESLPAAVAGPLLGAASFSFYATRIVFCEGDERSADERLYRAWFSGRETVVRPVGSRDLVIRCTSALRESGIAVGVEAIGMVDRDFFPAPFLGAQPAGVFALGVHEIESLYCVPTVVAAVAEHLGKEFRVDDYRAAVKTVVEKQLHYVVLERWKRLLRPRLESLVSAVSTKTAPLDEIVAAVPGFFDHTAWVFSPGQLLEDERERVQSAINSGELEDILCLMPGKAILKVAAGFTGLDAVSYCELVNGALAGAKPELTNLGERLAIAMTPYLPARATSAADSAALDGGSSSDETSAEA